MPPDKNSAESDKDGNGQGEGVHPDLPPDAALLAATQDAALVAALCKWKSDVVTRTELDHRLNELKQELLHFGRDLAALKDVAINEDRAKTLAIGVFRKELKFWGGIVVAVVAGLITLIVTVMTFWFDHKDQITTFFK